ncbi:AraC family transcriptional regulator [Parvularcula flava]|uniref:Transcriptional regulator n=1 Tax=Aquisalinus luteolus TaxID=1566827 RepID=A0A8J3A9R8_9PROT|nr:AraC family transcriptional regulator [Aquisalinus luteolus]NHK29494.1 AraC family transcriptional regulator [Aquisalinus luteolus]GGI01773.1 transcriptional regulator [Aquisalinus luteolus]
MPQISSFFVRKNIEQAQGLADAAELYALVGLEPGCSDPSATIDSSDYFALLEALAAREAPDVGFHMRTSASMRCEEYGAVGLAWKSAPTLRHSFSRMDRYSRQYNKIAAFLQEEDGELIRWTHVAATPPRLGSRLSTEAALGTFISLCREATSPDFAPEGVEFRHQPIGTTGAVEAYFGCPVRYGAERDALVFTASQFDAPNTIGDESIWRFFSSHLQEIFPDRQDTDFVDRQVVVEIANVLSNGVPTLQQIADRLNIGSRTLQRRLSERGLTFQDLIDEARRRLTRKLLANTRYSLAEIAYLAGFSDQSAFTRAFKRCFGQTPRAYREEVLAGASVIPREMANMQETRAE